MLHNCIITNHLMMMKKILITTIVGILSFNFGYAQNSVGIGTTTPNGKSILELSSTTQGLLPPRMTTLQRMGIAPGATEFGLVVYDTDLAEFYYWDGAGWKTMGSSGSNWIANGTDIYNGNSGYVGIGNISPITPLNIHTGIASTIGQFSIQGTASDVTNQAYMSFLNEDGVRLGFFGDATAAGDNILLISKDNLNLGAGDTGGDFYIESTGEIGIGTTTPSEKLHVAGNTLITDTLKLPNGAAVGSVLTSDATGNASWQDAAGGNAWELTGNTGSTAVNFLGTTDNVSLRFRTNNIERARIDSIGTFVVDKKILNYPSTINSGKEGSPSTFVLGTYSNTAEHNPRINLARHRGTYASPTAIQSGDWIGSLGFRGYDGANYPVAGSIFVNSSENWSTTQQGAIMMFQTTANGESAPSERMRIHSNGNVGVNSFDPKAKLQVFGTSNTSVLDSINQNRTSLGAQRFHFSTGDVFDIGFQSLPNYAAWMQAGFNGTAEPILLNPNGGNIGIGNNNPTARLHVSGNFRLEDGTQAAGRILTSDAAGNASWQVPSSSINIYNSNGSLTANRTITQGTNTLAFTSSATNGFSVDGNTFSIDALNNRVGIGTTTPNAKLHVDFGGISVNQYDNAVGIGVVLNNNTSTNASAFVWSNATVAALNVDMAGTSTDVATFRNTGNIVSRMLSDGSVQFNGRLLPGGVQGLAGQVLTSNGAGTPTWQTISASSLGAVTGAGAATRVAFWNGTNSLSSNTELYWDNTNNRLGVGTSTPTEKLEVSGNIKQTTDKAVFVRGTDNHDLVPFCYGNVDQVGNKINGPGSTDNFNVQQIGQGRYRIEYTGNRIFSGPEVMVQVTPIFDGFMTTANYIPYNNYIEVYIYRVEGFGQYFDTGFSFVMFGGG